MKKLFRLVIIGCILFPISSYAGPVITGSGGGVASVSVSDDESTNDEQEVVFTTDNANLESDGDFTYNPSSGTVTATTLAGELDPDRLSGDTSDDDKVDQDILEGFGGSANPAWIFEDTDAAATGTAYIAVDAVTAGQPAILQIKVDEDGGEDNIYAEFDGNTEKIELIYPVELGGDVTAASTNTALTIDADSANSSTIAIRGYNGSGWDNGLVVQSGSTTAVTNLNAGSTATSVVVISAYDTGVGYDALITGTSAAAPTLVLAADGGVTVQGVTFDTSGNIGSAGTFTASGAIQGLVNVTLDTDATVDLSSSTGADGEWRVNNDDDVIQYTLPPAAIGLTVCFYDHSASGQVISIDPDDGTDQIYLDGAGIGAGDELDSPGDRGDFACLMALDGDTWIVLGKSGTWVDGGAS